MAYTIAGGSVIDPQAALDFRAKTLELRIAKQMERHFSGTAFEGNIQRLNRLYYPLLDFRSTWYSRDDI
jgi:hypothetical protein